ncbi:helix-turn-helix domain-containing protein [Sphingomonas aurantiaca]|uniref:helix-turn-helix domain-containing protein n=1 Tax=Sphingomonas aurantiaca TaxID=185949 RepID=UPI003362A35C
MRATVTEKFLNKFRRKAYREAFVENEVRTGLAYQVRVLREQRNLSQDQLAKLMGTTQSAVSRLEDSDYGRVSLSTLFQVAKALDVGLMAGFCGFAEMVYRTRDVSPKALEVTSFSEEQFRISTGDSNIMAGFPTSSIRNAITIEPGGRATVFPSVTTSSHFVLETIGA